MANASQRKLIADIAVELGESLDELWTPWEFDYSRYGLAMTSEYSRHNILNVKPAVVCLYFGWDKPLSDVRVMFLGARSQHLNRRFGLRAFIAQDVLETLESIAIARDQFHLYVKQRLEPTSKPTLSLVK